MAAVPKNIFRAVATTGGTTATVPAGYRWVITSVVAVNTSAAAATVTVSLAGFQLVNQSIQPAGQYVLACAQVLDAAGAVNVAASAATSITVHISGVEQGI